jgi:succinate-semialdehyde dehydrogenase/glutarate-semialdehyde dehydrogenase
MITRKAGAALGVGCTMVLKPAAETPLSALALAALAEEAGIPPGVFNVVPGTDAEAIGREFTANNKVAKLSFTGSTEVGKQLLKDCANTVKKVSMELGGNAPALVFDDADLDMALDGVVASKYRNAGQTCICVNRVLVQGAIYDDFVARLKGRINTLIVGEGDRDGVLVGPLISAAAVDKVDGLISQACDSGAEIVCGGKPLARKGHFYEPTLVVNASSEMEIFKQEIFGPVTVVYRFEHEDEAIQQANGTRAGLAAYCYTRDAGRIWRLGERLEFGMVGINEVAISHAAIPFGGMKESGLGREGSRYGVDDYLEIKHVAMRV